MKILIAEDDPKKAKAIKNEIKSFYENKTIEFKDADTFSVAQKLIFENNFDLLIIDLLMPRRANEEPVDISYELIGSISDSKKNSNSRVIAISKWSNVVSDVKDDFAREGIILLTYSEERDDWKVALKANLQTVGFRQVFDFVIVCALDKERSAYRETECSIGELRPINGLDCMPMALGDYVGVCVKLPRMGLVESSIICTRAIEQFEPKIICMSGICAGFPDEVQKGTTIVPERTWEHQAGKWKDNNVFELSHYHAALPNDVQTLLSQFIEDEESLEGMKEGLSSNDEVLKQPFVMGPVVTGSAVVASQEYREDINAQHRKIAGLDMELYGLYRAVELATYNVIGFGAKTVVDVADGTKDDTIHNYGSILSARFTIAAIKKLFSELIEVS